MVDLITFFNENEDLLNIVRTCSEQRYMPTILSSSKDRINKIYESIYGYPIANRSCSHCRMKAYQDIYGQYLLQVKEQEKEIKPKKTKSNGKTQG